MKGDTDAARLRIDLETGFIEMAGGKRIDLTRTERLALIAFLANPGRILTRQQLLDAITEPGSDARDRNVDFLVNRLRRKLSDNARAPLYIATRYGEGYVWIGGSCAVDPVQDGTCMVIGPLTGLDRFPAIRSQAEIFAWHLQRAFGAVLGPGKPVIVLPEYEADEAGAVLSVELSFFSNRGRIGCVIGLRDAASHRPLAACRLSQDDLGRGPAFVERLARSLLDRIWFEDVTLPRDDTPLPVALLAVALGDQVPFRNEADADHRRIVNRFEWYEARTLAAWRESERRLRALLDEDPADAQLKLMLAVTLHSVYASAGHRLFAEGIDRRAAHEDEIESLVNEALPQVSADPDSAILAGKLLHFLRRGYDELGRDLCETAFSKSTSVSRSLAMVGQMRAFFGETHAALEAIEQALAISQPGSHAHSYALIFKGQTLAAANDWDGLAEVRKAFWAVSAIGGLFFELVFGDPERPALRARAVMLLMSRKRAQGHLLHAHYVCGRLFRDPVEGARTLRPLKRLVTGRFGRRIVPDEVRAAYGDGAG